MNARDQSGWGESDVVDEVDRLGYVYRLDGIAFRMYVTRSEGADREIRFTAATPGHPEVRLPVTAAA